MTDTELRHLIRVTIDKVLAAGATPSRPDTGRTSHPALVLFTGALLGYAEALNCLGEVQSSGIQLDFVQTDSAARILDQSEIRALGMTEITHDLVSDHPVLIIPTLTVNTAAKVAYGFGDSLATNVIQEFIMLNRPIVAARTGACPDSHARSSWFPHMPEPYKEQLRRNLQAMASYGTRLCRAEDLHATVMTCWQDLKGQSDVTGRRAAAPVEVPRTPVTQDSAERLISQQSIETLPDGSVLRISRAAQVTALARDGARERSIRIEQS